MKYYGIIDKEGNFSYTTTWNECKQKVRGVSGIKYKSFSNYDDLLAWKESMFETYYTDVPAQGICLYSDGGSRTCNGRARQKGVSHQPTDLSAWAFTVVSDSTLIHCDSGFIRGKTNNYNELFAVYNGLIYLKQSNYIRDSITLVTDSKYVISVLRYDWNKANLDKPNYALGKATACLFNEFSNIHIKWVKGHQDTYFNNMCDEMCTKEMEEHK